MADQIQIKVISSGASAVITELRQIEQYITKLNGQQIKLSVDASGFQALEASVLKTINAQTRYNNSVARVKEAQNAVAIAQQKTAQLSGGQL